MLMSAIDIACTIFAASYFTSPFTSFWGRGPGEGPPYFTLFPGMPQGWIGAICGAHVSV
jgi:hypothetical protein